MWQWLMQWCYKDLMHKNKDKDEDKDLIHAYNILLASCSIVSGNCGVTTAKSENKHISKHM